MDIIIASFDSISEVNMDYTITMYLHQYWTDERLSWGGSVPIDEMTLSGEFSQNIWVPDTFLANDKHSFLHEVTERNKMLRISGDGKIAYGMRLTSTLSCSMNLRNFPLDSQNCTVEIESYGYTTSEVLMLWNRPKAVHGVEDVDVPQFTITGYQTEDRVVSTATGDVCFVFVFAALLEYAAVNYSYWGRRSRGGGEEGWPVCNSNKDDRESAVNIKEWGVPSSLIDLKAIQLLNPRTHDLNSTALAATAPESLSSASRKKRQSSPIPSLCPSGPNGIDEDDSPEYPRYASTVQGAIRCTYRTARRLRTTRLRAQSMTMSLHRMGVRARKALPRIRVRDVNVIDKYSRTVFPICFVIFNIFYWGYYSIIQL
ncbi:Cation transporter family protein [Cooperia oncophora]